MKRLIIAVILILAVANCQTANETTGTRIVLPNPKLLRCASSDCFSLWLEKSAEADAIFPKQTIIDMEQGCLYGLRAIYDKSVSIEDLRAAIDGHYGKWKVPGFEDSSIKLWRVEPDKFAIQLGTNNKRDEKRNLGDVGTKNVIYSAFVGKSGACGTP